MSHMAHVRMKSVIGQLAGAVAALAVFVATPNGAAAQPKKNKAVKKPVKVNVVKSIANLGSDSVDKSAKAAMRLGYTKDARALEALLNRLALGAHPKVLAAALQSVAKHKSAKAHDTIKLYLGYRDSRVRAAAVTAIGSIKQPRTVKPVLHALRDGTKSVRAAACKVIEQRKIRRAIEALLALMKKGDEATASAVAVMANPNLARMVGELIGKAPNAIVARTLGLILLRPSFKPESARVEVVKALGKVPGTDAVEQLSAYLEAIPEKPPRRSRRVAQKYLETRLGGN